jgi:glycosyltransferase involved in cell wall biosynthesis
MSKPVELRAAEQLGVSVVICCHNGAARLPRTLAYLQKQSVPASLAWEVVLVDNASTDGSGEIAEKVWQHPTVTLRIVREERLGLTFARERSLAVARYEIVTFVDDDNWVCERWVARVAQIMSEHPEVGLCGGYSSGVIKGERPAWFDKYANYYAVGPLALPGDVTERVGMLWGAGMCIRMRAWQDLVNIGVRLLSTTVGDDHELSLAMRLAGWRLWLDAELQLEHFIPADRLSWNYFLDLQRTRNKHLVASDGYFLALEDGGKGMMANLRRSWSFQFLQAVRNLASNLLVRPNKVLNRSSSRFEGDGDVVRIESYAGRLAGLWQFRKEYAQFVGTAQRIAPNSRRRRQSRPSP